MARSRAGSSSPVERRAGDRRGGARCAAVRGPGNDSTLEEVFGERKRLEVAVRELEDVTVRGREPSAHRGRLGAMAALAQHRPRRRLVRRVEEHRPQPGDAPSAGGRSRGRGCRPPPTPCPEWSSESTRRTCASHEAGSASPISRCVIDTARVLGEDGGRVMEQVVGDERERHRVAVGFRPSRVGPETETRSSGKGERPVGRDGDDPSTAVGHRCLRLLAKTDDQVDDHGEHDAHHDAERDREEEREAPAAHRDAPGHLGHPETR